MVITRSLRMVAASTRSILASEELLIFLPADARQVVMVRKDRRHQHHEADHQQEIGNVLSTFHPSVFIKSCRNSPTANQSQR